MRKIVWFSCGAASAVTSKIAVKKYPDCHIVYCDTGSEHPDNERFLKDVEKWIGKKVEILKSAKYSDIWDVFTKTRFISGPYGARCTMELKKKLREDYQNDDDVQIFGFTSEEEHRATRFEYNYPEIQTEWPLIDNDISKQECLALLADAGIEIPEMYKLGYKNNNCIGCCKGKLGYWGKIKKDFPEIYDRMAKIEREIGAAINKRYEGEEMIKMFLDEIPEGLGNYSAEPDISCGILCHLKKELF